MMIMMTWLTEGSICRAAHLPEKRMMYGIMTGRHSIPEEVW